MTLLDRDADKFEYIMKTLAEKTVEYIESAH